MIAIGQEVWVLGKYLPRSAIVTRLSDGEARPYYLLEVHPEPIRFHPQRLGRKVFVLEHIYLSREAALTAQRQANREGAVFEHVDKLRVHYNNLHEFLSALADGELA